MPINSMLSLKARNLVVVTNFAPLFLMASRNLSLLIGFKTFISLNSSSLDVGPQKTTGGLLSNG